jgi:hypothetical protein
MRRAVVLMLAMLGALGAPASGRAADKVRVVATTTDLKALTEAVIRTPTISRCGRASW